MVSSKLLSTLRLLLPSVVLFPAFLFPQQSQWRLAEGTVGRIISDIDVFTGNQDTVYAMCANCDYGIMLSTDRGETWDTLSAFLAGAGPIKTDPLDSRIAYGWFRWVGGFSSYVTRDGWQTWTLISHVPSYGGSLIIEIDPIDPNTVYVSAGPSYFLRTTDRGLTWAQVPTPEYINSSLAIAPSDNNILYAGYYYDGVFKSTDRGSTWTNVWPYHFGYGVRLAVDPTDADIVYAGIPGLGSLVNRVYKSTDGGLTWLTKNNGLVFENWGVETVVVNPEKREEIYLGTWSPRGAPFYRSTNGAETWEPYAGGLPDSLSIWSIAIDTMHERIYIAGRSLDPNESGIYILDNPISAVPNDDKEISAGYILYPNHPNPFNSQTTIEFSLPIESFVELNVYSVLGQEITMIIKGVIERGTHHVKFDAQNLPSGVYTYRLRADSFLQTRLMIIIK